jgi:hypothetical protein
MKCIYRQELLFCEEPSVTLEDEELFDGTGDAMREEGEAVGEKGWNSFVGDLQDSRCFQDI